MKVHTTRDFSKELQELPIEVSQYFEKQKILFEANWLDPRLHTKRLKELHGVFSLRITSRYRALFYLRNNEGVFFAIGHRKDVYR